MSALLGLLNISDAAADRTFVSTVGQRLVFDAVTALLTRYNAELSKIKSVFVERTTSEYTLRYKLPGGGRLQRRGGLAQSGAVKAYGGYDVAFPLEDFGVQFGGDRIALAYMTARELDRHLDTVFIQDTNTVRFEILKALFNNTARTFQDPHKGALTIQPLANNDAVTYPPVLGSESEATDNHYLASGYITSAISDANNPFPVIRAELTEHFGVEQGGENIAVLFNPDATPYVQNLADFDEVNSRFVIPGANTDQLRGVPAGLPGTLIGRVANGGWAVEWPWMPSGYMVGLHLDAPPPLVERIDPPETGLRSGFNLVAEDEDYPLESSHYEHRFGLGVGNRLSAVVMQLVVGSYSIPAAYA